MDCEMINHFDSLPDDLLRLILNRVLNAKSLCACLAVSTRFNSLALHTTSISLSVDSIHFNDDDDNDLLPHDSPSLLHSFITLFISKPLRFLTTLASRASSSTLAHVNNSNATAAFYSPTDALKSFSRIEVLKIQLPSHGELQLDRANHPLLKWKATFGCELKTCVIVAATAYDHIKKPDYYYYDEERPPGWVESRTVCAIKDEQDGNGVISNDDLKMRVVWTISCLIAASSRHHLLKRIVAQHPMLKSIEMVDEHRQGTLTMEEADISQMRNKSISEYEEGSTDRTRIPALKMKMWHAAELELPECNKVMRGATLVMIGAAADGEEVVGVEGTFDDEMMYGEVAKEIRKKMKQSYSLEMDSF